MARLAIAWGTMQKLGRPAGRWACVKGSGGGKGPGAGGAGRGAGWLGRERRRDPLLPLSQFSTRAPRPGNFPAPCPPPPSDKQAVQGPGWVAGWQARRLGARAPLGSETQEHRPAALAPSPKKKCRLANRRPPLSHPLVATNTKAPPLPHPLAPRGTQPSPRPHSHAPSHTHSSRGGGRGARQSGGGRACRACRQNQRQCGQRDGFDPRMAELALLRGVLRQNTSSL